MATGGLARACVILGAGASADVAGEGSIIKSSAFRPPLARDLFDIENNPAFWDVLERYKGAAFLTQMLAPVVSSGEISIEEELRKYAEHPNDQIRQHFKHIPAYLRDLIYRASTQYTDVPSSYVRLIYQLLAEYPHDVLFLTLNYDTLLEAALTLFAPKFQFGAMSDYVAPDRNAKVVKLHGSINWFRLMPGGGNWESLVTALDIFEQIPENQIIVSNSNIPCVMDVVEEQYRVYPLLTAPLAGKEPNDMVCPKSHITATREFLSNCKKFLIIGTSGLDQDLLYLLESAISPELHPLVHIVDAGEEEAYATRHRFENVVRAFHDPRVIPSNSTFDNGFRAYLSGGELRSFAELDVER